MKNDRNFIRFNSFGTKNRLIMIRNNIKTRFSPEFSSNIKFFINITKNFDWSATVITGTKTGGKILTLSGTHDFGKRLSWLPVSTKHLISLEKIEIFTKYCNPTLLIFTLSGAKAWPGSFAPLMRLNWYSGFEFPLVERLRDCVWPCSGFWGIGIACDRARHSYGK